MAKKGMKRPDTDSSKQSKNRAKSVPETQEKAKACKETNWPVSEK